MLLIGWQEAGAQEVGGKGAIAPLLIMMKGQDMYFAPLLKLKKRILFGRPYYRSSLWYSVSSVCLSACRLWRFVLWQNGAS